MCRTPARAVSTVLMLGLLAGCASTHVAADVSSPGMPNPEVALRRSLAQVNQDMTAIGAMRPYSYAGSAPVESVVPAELQKPVQFVWTGSLDDGVKKLADSIGYTVSVTGPANPRAFSVAVNVAAQVISAFRALGDQAGAYATVQLDPLHHLVEVTHHV